MARPAVAELTGRWFDTLPELYRAADEADTTVDGWPLLRFMSLLGDQADEIRALADRFALHPNPDDPAGPWISDLSNPSTADAGWLGWLAQVVGLGLHAGPGTAETFNQLVIDYPTFADLAADNASFAMVRHHAAVVTTGGVTGPEGLRTALLDLTGARYAGSTGAWERLLAPFLTGARRVLHNRVVGGDAWHLHLETYADETPDPAVVGAVIADTVHAAGLTVTYATRTGSSFDAVAGGFADFDALTAAFADFDDLTAWTP